MPCQLQERLAHDQNTPPKTERIRQGRVGLLLTMRLMNFKASCAFSKVACLDRAVTSTPTVPHARLSTRLKIVPTCTVVLRTVRDKVFVPLMAPLRRSICHKRGPK